MTIRAINIKTGKKTTRALTPDELAEAEANTAVEIEERANQIDPDADLQSDIASATDFASLKAALLGQGPKQAKVKGRK